MEIFIVCCAMWGVSQPGSRWRRQRKIIMSFQKEESPP